jgi:hypothetical protein
MVPGLAARTFPLFLRHRRPARRRHEGRKASGFVLLALLGTWVAHTLEYLRVWGTDGLVTRLSAPLHLWMLPVGGAFLALAGAGGMRWVRLHRALGEQLDRARAQLARRLRNLPPPPREPRRRAHAVPAGTRVAPPVAAPVASLSARLAALWLSLSVSIGLLYLLQENIEAAAASLPRPGLAPITGIHMAAPLVVAAVAFVVAACAVEGRRRTSAVARDVGAVERLLRALDGLRTRVATPLADPGAPPCAGLERLGAQLWCRPPPLGLPAH